MLSLLRIQFVPPPANLKLSPPPRPAFPFSPLGKRAVLAAVLADTSNSPAGDCPAAAICHPKGVNSLATDVQRLSLFPQPPPIRDDAGGTGDDSIAYPSTTPPDTTTSDSGLAHDTYPSSVFPVYGPFDLLYCIQTGGFGVTWAAKDQSTGRLLCLKAFQSLQEPHMSRTVRAELNAFRRMVKSDKGERGRQFIMGLSRSIQHGTNVYFAMELMATDLGSYLYFEPERCKMHACRWMAQIALGIQSLHEMEIIHRDIKCDNILIDSRENIRIIDFGLAYLGLPGEPLRRGDGKATEFLGTPPYMAPEMLRNKGLPTKRRQRYGNAVDWWALGCILFELESPDHQLLFNTEDDVHAYVSWTQGPRQSEQMYTRFHDVDPVVVNLLEGLLQVEPSARYSLDDMEKHIYFLRHDGISEFDNATAKGTDALEPQVLTWVSLMGPSVLPTSALARSVHLELVPRSTADYGPIMVIESAKPGAIHDWTNLKWAHLVDG